MSYIWLSAGRIHLTVRFYFALSGVVHIFYDVKSATSQVGCRRGVAAWGDATGRGGIGAGVRVQVGVCGLCVGVGGGGGGGAL